MTRSTSPSESDVVVEVHARVRLYVAGEAPNSVAAVTSLRAALAQYPERRIELEIVDVLEEPERALRDGVLVTPMLAKLAPPPERRILGTLADRVRLLGVLGLDAPGHE